MTPIYTPHNWFWIVGDDDTKAWSSAANGYVTEWPATRLTRIASEADLWAVLREAGIGVAPALSRRQLLLGLLGLGVTEAQVYEVIKAIPDPTVREATRIEFENNDRILREHPLVAQLGGAFSLTAEQIDAAWAAAALL